MTTTSAPALVSVPALRVWIRDRVGPIDCDRCRGRRAYVCMACAGDGVCLCNMDYEHTCRSCGGRGFHKCAACTMTIEWEDIPRPLVRICNVEVGAWDLLDALSLLRTSVARAQAEGERLVLHTDKDRRVVEPAAHYDTRTQQPVLDYPTDQMVLPVDA